MLNQRKTSTKRRTFFLYKLNQNCFLTRTRTKRETPTMFFVSFRQLLDPIYKKRLKKCQISEKRQSRDDFLS